MTTPRIHNIKGLMLQEGRRYWCVVAVTGNIAVLAGCTKSGRLYKTVMTRRMISRVNNLAGTLRTC